MEIFYLKFISQVNLLVSFVVRLRYVVTRSLKMSQHDLPVGLLSFLVVEGPFPTKGRSRRGGVEKGVR